MARLTQRPRIDPSHSARARLWHLTQQTCIRLREDSQDQQDALEEFRRSIGLRDFEPDDDQHLNAALSNLRLLHSEQEKEIADVLWQWLYRPSRMSKEQAKQVDNDTSVTGASGAASAGNSLSQPPKKPSWSKTVFAPLRRLAQETEWKLTIVEVYALFGDSYMSRNFVQPLVEFATAQPDLLRALSIMYRQRSKRRKGQLSQGHGASCTVEWHAIDIRGSLNIIQPQPFLNRDARAAQRRKAKAEGACAETGSVRATSCGASGDRVGAEHESQEPRIPRQQTATSADATSGTEPSTQAFHLRGEPLSADASSVNPSSANPSSADHSSAKTGAKTHEDHSEDDDESPRGQEEEHPSADDSSSASDDESEASIEHGRTNPSDLGDDDTAYHFDDFQLDPVAWPVAGEMTRSGSDKSVGTSPVTPPLPSLLPPPSPPLPSLLPPPPQSPRLPATPTPCPRASIIANMAAPRSPKRVRYSDDPCAEDFGQYDSMLAAITNIPEYSYYALHTWFFLFSMCSEPPEVKSAMLKLTNPEAKQRYYAFRFPPCDHEDEHNTHGPEAPPAGRSEWAFAIEDTDSGGITDVFSCSDRPDLALLEGPATVDMDRVTLNKLPVDKSKVANMDTTLASMVAVAAMVAHLSSKQKASLLINPHVWLHAVHTAIQQISSKSPRRNKALDSIPAISPRHVAARATFPEAHHQPSASSSHEARKQQTLAQNLEDLRALAAHIDYVTAYMDEHERIRALVKSRRDDWQHGARNIPAEDGGDMTIEPGAVLQSELDMLEKLRERAQTPSAQAVYQADITRVRSLLEKREAISHGRNTASKLKSVSQCLAWTKVELEDVLSELAKRKTKLAQDLHDDLTEALQEIARLEPVST